MQLKIQFAPIIQNNQMGLYHEKIKESSKYLQLKQDQWKTPPKCSGYIVSARTPVSENFPSTFSERTNFHIDILPAMTQ